MGLFGRRNRERQAQQDRDDADRAQARAGLARELEDERTAGPQAAGGSAADGITISGPEPVNITGQAIGGMSARRPPERTPPEREGQQRGPESGSPLIVNTGRGQVNIADSAIGHGAWIDNRRPKPGDSPKAAGREIEAG